MTRNVKDGRVLSPNAIDGSVTIRVHCARIRGCGERACILFQGRRRPIRGAVAGGGPNATVSGSAAAPEEGGREKVVRG